MTSPVGSTASRAAALDFVVAIPARHDATRLPGKPLRLLGGTPLVVHVARRALAAGAREVWVAADDQRIVDALQDVGVQVAMTSRAHRSGTDRLAECADIAGWADDTIVVNLQGDEPFAPASGIRATAQLLAGSDARMSALATAGMGRGTLVSPNAVKLVRDGQGHALYFSRAPIPWDRDALASQAPLAFPGPWLRHIGIYGYRAGFLREVATLPPGQLEQLESLEQLRVLEAGHRIVVGLSPAAFPPGVDSPEDLERAEAHLATLGA